ncbi:hypothetical protein [Microbacterium sp. NC79]|uniref:hypothetical protein n=1 Tax=Microbacterium sp. NC79 TaxID=2851009 RepID=UPI001C2C8F47|nr:hypothetical protein [Microbacterium sp. NC79]MBV0895727.1 hypothetical protein [Microbacterium sp. NC79]
MREAWVDWRADAVFVLLGIGSWLLAFAIWWGFSEVSHPTGGTVLAWANVAGVGLAGAVVVVVILKITRRELSARHALATPVIVFAGGVLIYGLFVGMTQGWGVGPGFALAFAAFVVVPTLWWSVFWGVSVLMNSCRTAKRQD